MPSPDGPSIGGAIMNISDLFVHLSLMSSIAIIFVAVVGLAFLVELGWYAHTERT
jgi:hypothetical protein